MATPFCLRWSKLSENNSSLISWEFTTSWIHENTQISTWKYSSTILTQYHSFAAEFFCFNFFCCWYSVINSRLIWCQEITPFNASYRRVAAMIEFLCLLDMHDTIMHLTTIWLCLPVTVTKLNQIKSNKIKSNQIKSNQITNPIAEFENVLRSHPLAICSILGDLLNVLH